MFEILIYVFENYIHCEDAPGLDRKKLLDELELAGFDPVEIQPALDWLEKLSRLRKQDPPWLNDCLTCSTRIYTLSEMRILDEDCRGFLLFLEQAGVLDPASRELVIDRVMALGFGDVDLDDLKWVVLMVLFNLPGHEEAFSQMESLLFDRPEGYLH